MGQILKFGGETGEKVKEKEKRAKKEWKTEID
jgi:hypothetical protein